MHLFFQGGQLTPFASMCGRPWPSVTDRLLIIMAFSCNIFFFLSAVVVQWIMGFLYGQRECLFVAELINEYFTKQIF